MIGSRLSVLAHAVLLVCCVPLLADDSTEKTKVVFMVGEREYETEASLRRFFSEDLAHHGFDATFVTAPAVGPEKNDFAGIEKALETADILILSVRRRAPKAEQLRSVRDFLNSGKPLVGIRTASHPFDTKGNAPPGHAEWLNFDTEVLGGKYSGHYGSEACRITIAPNAMSDPILKGVELGESSKLYKGRVTSPNAELILNGELGDGTTEAVAWKHRYGPRSARVFYTSLGITTDFEQAGFRRLLLNAIQDCLGQAAPSPETNGRSTSEDEGAISPK